MTESAAGYTPALARVLEAKWQERWRASALFRADNPTGALAGPKAAREPEFVLDMFPYPSGSGLHVGHPLGFIATDVYARYSRSEGRNVLYTMGFDAFGLPAEQFAVQTGVHPGVATRANIERYRQQLARLGMSYDERRSLATTDPAFYRWTQWIFLQLYESWFNPEAGRAEPVATLLPRLRARLEQAGENWDDVGTARQEELLGEYRLAYRKESEVNWCPGLGTVLADEEVTSDNRSERGNFPVFRKRLRQWHLRITAYADRLLADLDDLDWPESIKVQQRNWIGRSTGAAIDFPVVGDSGARVTVFSTRPETLFGATFLVLSPRHPLVDAGLAVPAGGAVLTDHRVAHPVTGEALPVYVADYVLSDYGTGAIMGVPAHDDRDAALARAEGLPFRAVLDSDGEGDAEPLLVGSAAADLDLDGSTIPRARELVAEWLERSGLGSTQYRYRLRDWLFSRQRYWGEPFPIVYDESDVPHAVPPSQLPVELPPLDDYKPFAYDPDDADSVPEAPLGRARDWVHAELDLGDGPRRYRRETDTMPNWAGSSWYELRYLDPGLGAAAWDPENERYWLGPDARKPKGGADLYVGGAEHAVLHLLYARFWHKVLHDLGLVSSSEPFSRLYNQGVIQAYVYRDDRGIAVEAQEVEERDGQFFWRGEPVSRHLGKMGKSLKNSITPDEICDLYGADTLRLYEMSMGPLDTSRPWDTRAVVGGLRFLQRLWRNVVGEDGRSRVTDDAPQEALTRQLHRVLSSYHQDVPLLRLNTAISRLIELNNTVTREGIAPRSVMVPLVQMVAPFAPHVAEELWERMGEPGSVSERPVPRPEDRWLSEDLVTCVVQVNGKVRARIAVPKDIDEALLESLALGEERVQQAIGGGEPLRVIVKPPSVVNVVVRPRA